MKLSKRTWITKDASGCEFVCKAYYTGIETIYVAEGLNLESKTLSGLKLIVANYKR